MSLIIDGYNLLFAIGISPSRDAADLRLLERARKDLLDFLSVSLPTREVQRTTVVFDAADAPRGLPATYRYRGLEVRFARGYTSADELIEVLIRKEPAPKQLTVVSSDHRVQQAARRRRATAVDSEPWYESVQRDARRRQPSIKPPPDSSDDKKTAARDETLASSAPTDLTEVDYWLREFATDAAETAADIDIDGIFPQGYGENEGSEEDT